MSFKTLVSHDIVALKPFDQIDEYFIPKGKIVFGPDGNYSDVTLATPFPVTDSQIPSVTGYLSQIDTDLVAFKNANHQDLLSVTGFLDQQTTLLTSLDSKASNSKSNSASITRVNASVSSVQLLALNSARIAAYFFNESASICYLKLGTTASATSYTKRMDPGEFLILNLDPVYTGRIDAIWVTAVGAMQVTELTP